MADASADQVVEGSANPADAGRPTLFVYLDEAGEVQVGTNWEFDPTEIAMMLGVAKAKIELLGYRIAKESMRRQAVRDTLLQGVR